MNENIIFEALNDCIERIEAGESVDACLRDYPEYADRLRDLLILADYVGRAQFSDSEVDAAKNRSIERMQSVMASRSQRKVWYMRYLPAATAIAAVFVVILGAGVLFMQQQSVVFFSMIVPQTTQIANLNEVQPQQGAGSSTTGSTQPGRAGNAPAPEALKSADDAPADEYDEAETSTEFAASQPSPAQVGIVGDQVAEMPPVPTMMATQEQLLDVEERQDVDRDALADAEGEEEKPAVEEVAQMSTSTAAPTMPPPTMTPTPPPTMTAIPTTLPPTPAEGVIPDMPPDMFFRNYGVNPFLDTEDDTLSTFAMDVDTASYTLARRFLNEGMLPPADAIRSEEFINYFDVGYPGPEGNDAFAIHLEAAPAPFGFDGHYLMRVGLQGKRIALEDRDPALLVFIIDVSGSMADNGRLEQVKAALRVLVDQLNETDRIGIVTYTDYASIALEPTSAANRSQILGIIDSLQPLNSTNAEAGLQMGYIMARGFMREGEITRVILLSDGVANVGTTDPNGILGTIRSSVEQGITLTAIGVGMGNYNDILLEQLANNGNGSYYYVDDVQEATRVFATNLVGTLQVIAFDAKVQVEFHKDVTDRYRLIGYENRDVADVDFRNDTIDAGEVGAGHSVTALYELALENEASGTVATVFIRYRDAATGEVIELSRPLTTAELRESIDATTPGFRLHAAVAEFSELLRESYWSAGGRYGAVLALLETALDELEQTEQITELMELVKLAIQYGDR